MIRDRIERLRVIRAIQREVQPSRFAHFGEGTIIHPPVRTSARERISIGDGSYVLHNATFALGPEGSLTIGSRVYLGRDLTIVATGPVVIGDDVMGSDRLVIADAAPTPGGIVAENAVAPARPVVIEDGVFLGIGCVVLAGVTLGASTFVGANAVVTESTPPNSVVVGNPARVIRRHDPGSGEWISG